MDFRSYMEEDQFNDLQTYGNDDYERTPDDCDNDELEVCDHCEYRFDCTQSDDIYRGHLIFCEAYCVRHFKTLEEADCIHCRFFEDETCGYGDTMYWAEEEKKSQED